jgi:MYXO-CTERM domain-containing protein
VTSTKPTTTTLASGQATLSAGSWHNVKLVFQGTSIKGIIDGTQAFTKTDTTYSKGSVGLGTAPKTTALFDNLLVTDVGAAKPAPTTFSQDGQSPPDGGAGGSTGTGGSGGAGGAPGTGGGAGAGGNTRTGGSSGAGGVIGTGGSRIAGSTGSGGSIAIGGTTSVGGSNGSSGTIAPGGTSGGGTSGVAGNADLGGTISAAGNPETGGITGAAGNVDTGGIVGVAGDTGVGGTTGAAGDTGASGHGGSGGQTKSTTAAAVDSGCSCSVGRTGGNDGRVGWLLFAGLAAIAIFRPRRNRTRARHD